MAAEYWIWQTYVNGDISAETYTLLITPVSEMIKSVSYTSDGMVVTWTPDEGFSIKPIGAFYDSQSSTYDNANSIADKTGVLVDGQGRRVSLTTLQGLDKNHDKILSVAEASELKLLTDLNENGHLDAGELNAVTSAIYSVNWSKLTRGNAVMSGYEAVAPTVVISALPSVINLGQPGQTNLTQVVPNSKYRTLRDTDNFYVVAGNFTFYWSSSDIKINNGTRNTLIGTDGNDSFDASYITNSTLASLFPTTLTNYLGGNGDDQVGGSGGNDNIWGGTGNDVVYGLAGNDNLYGEEGADTLLGQDGNDYLDGGSGDDQLFGYAGNDTLWGGDGNDLLVGFKPSNDTKQTLNAGETDDDYIYGGAGVDNIYGGLGNDYLDGGADTDYLLGEQGDDRLFGGDGADELHGNEGNDQLVGGAGDDKLFGQVGNDTLWGGDGNDVLKGFTATYETNQTLNDGETDEDYLYGGTGADTLNGGVGNDYLDGGTDNDLLVGGQGDDRLFGGDGADELQGSEGNDQVVGGTGDDKMFGQVGNDTLWGGEGNDILVGFTGANEAKQTLNAGETDDDVLYGESGNDNLFGGLGDDSLDGGIGNDFLMGEQGNDQLFGGEGADELQGNEGNDQLVGGAGDDRLFGQVGDDVLWGDDGNDLLMGFTGTNEARQTLNAGETDDDTLCGGVGSDIIIGGLGSDLLYGGDGRDELQGGVGNDLLYGDAGNDNLFGQVGDDILYGGEGDDLLVGFTASNEVQQTLNPEETDNDYLYGGAGHDTLIGGAGDDYLDGGEASDVMVGGTGNDTYIVNSVNDTIYEAAGEGYDTVITNKNFLLNANIEELRLLEGSVINGTGNALDNLIVGNSSDNILDGVTGADTMIGGQGNDIYYVDNVGDLVTELAGEGAETVQSSISYQLGSNVENLLLLDFAKPEKGLVDGQNVLVYGYPKRNELDYMQGDAVQNYLGTCALTSIANLITQTGRPTSESQVVNLAIQNNWAVNDPSLSHYQLGGSSVSQQRAILDEYGIRNDVVIGYNESGIANLVRSGRGVILSMNAGQLWGDAAYIGNGTANHAVTLTGAVYSEADGTLKGFYIADSGRGLVSDMTRFVDITTFRNAANVSGGYSIYTIAPIKFWQEDIDGTGNELDNTLVGNRGDNALMGLSGNDVLQGAAGNDTLAGGIGDDTLEGGTGDDTYQFNLGDGHDVITDSQGTDTLVFGQGVQANDVVVSRDGTSLILIISGQDSVRIDGISGDGKNSIDQVQFADGMVWYALEDGSGYNASLSGWVEIDGQAEQGQTLTLTNTLADADGLGEMHYQWQTSSDGITWRDLAGATGLSYSLGQSDVGQRLRVNVSYVDGRGNEEDVATLMTGAIANVNDAPTGTVSVSGTATQGQLLTAGNTLADADGLGTIVYQWQSSGDGVTWTNIAGATEESYILKQSEAGLKVRAVASYTDGFGTQESVSSTATDAVASRNHAPVVAHPIADQNGVEDSSFSFVVPSNTFTDVDSADTISYSVTLADGSAIPSWLSFDTSTHTFSGTPDSSSSGAVAVKVTATDSSGVSVSDDFVISITNHIAGTSGNDYLTGTDQADLIDGYAGSDEIHGGAGDDILSGGADNDSLSGEAGNDTYLFGRGDGQDTIYLDYDTSAGKMNVLQFKAGIAASDVVVTRLSTSLVLSISGTTDSVMAMNFFSGDNPSNASNPLQQVIFEDGTVWDLNTIKAKALVGNATDQTLKGYVSDDVISAAGGNDTVYGQAGNDILNGGNGDDALYGGSGSDTYLFENLYGKDTIHENDSTAGNSDRIVLGATIVPGQVGVSRDGTDLLLTVGSGDQLRVEGWFIDDAHKVERVEFADGTVWTVADLKLKANNAPVVAVPLSNQSVTANRSFVYAVPSGSFTDADSSIGDMLTYSVRLADGSLLPSWLTFDATTLTFSGTPSNTDAGNLSVKVMATDQLGAVVSSIYTLSVVALMNHAPVLSRPIADQSAVEDTLFTFALPSNTFTDIDTGDTLTYKATLADATALPSWLVFNAATRSFSGTPTSISSGSLTVKVTATDGSGVLVNDEFVISIANHIAGTFGNDALTGTAQADVIDGYAGNDTLNGDVGADTLVGGIGNDTYYVDNKGDVIVENANEGTDLVQSSVTYTLSKNVENLTLSGTAAINGIGNQLDNVLTGNTGDNNLDGGAGNDILNGSSGNDVLDGGVGNDTLNGGQGNDRYCFARGGGQDLIVDTDAKVGNSDVLAFSSDVGYAQLWFRHVGNDLDISIIGGSDMVVIRNWYSGSAYHVEQIRSGDGKVLVDANVNALVQAMSTMMPPAVGQTVLPSATQTQLAPVLAANWN